ncbi:ATP-binding protein [Actinokineospora bangkokensis]|uniref:Anti-sigma factor n=1 Tax=Actinokineospora bangkokensis TaxID=1193682 RepID=A0A1Q9LQJ9_9PSEU|nr:hypothetical protein [Actinokineospora bangkokensis]OLR94298.1 hypothetical protein BJP25_11020 [Actinokineospora bangkokensis]
MTDSEHRVAGGSTEAGSAFAPAVDDRIRVRLAADLANLPVVRSVAGTVAALLDHDIDAISDLKLAVDEVCSTLITRARPGAALECSFARDGDLVRVEAWVPTGEPVSVDTSSFGWKVLTTLTDEVDSWSGPGRDGEPQLRIAIARGRTGGTP